MHFETTYIPITEYGTKIDQGSKEQNYYRDVM